MNDATASTALECPFCGAPVGQDCWPGAVHAARFFAIRDSRLKPLVETGTGSIGEADESGGAQSAIAQTPPSEPRS